ncbi:HIT family protein [Candidatus Woesearchaeota archaeon]|nr:HIT family protein [Candidatus Woesearchaeota archaeon]
MKDCIFCKIGKKEIPADIIYEDKEFIAFLDIRPLNLGHTLIIPKKHYRWIWDVDNFGEYFEVVKRIEKGIVKTLKPLRVLVLVFGEEVHHAHTHLVPRFENDGHSGTITLGLLKEISKEEMKKIAEKIRKNI